MAHLDIAMLSHLQTFFTHKKSLAVGSGFFLLGFLFGNWATLIPYIKSFYKLDDGILGLMLLCLPLGAMSFNPIAAILIQRFGFQKTTVFGMLFLSFAFVLPITISTIILLPFTLIMAGMSMTLLNISVNTAATVIEKQYNINIMSTCHGMFSLGLMTGSLMRSFTFLFDIDEKIHMLIMAGMGLIITFFVGKTILSIHTLSRSTDDKPSKFRLVLPKGVLLSIVIISICINVTEGSITDWASVYMKDVVQTSPFFIGWGLFGYSTFMALGRLFGDGIIPIFGKNNVLVYGAALALGGLLITIFLPFTWTAIAGFGLIGLGVSCGAPILYASAARYPGLPDSGGLAIMNTFAMGGFLMGPVVIGFISDLSSLSVAFGFVLFLALVWMFISRKVELF
ncbi:MAG: MFS transporter [Saprospiraceae bacterium]